MTDIANNSLERLTRALDESRLVIFVGAGVSKNSNLPSWIELIKPMAQALSMDTSSTFDNTDFLKIPEILYQKDRHEYESILQDSLEVDAKSNELDELIVQLAPHHIITTNYDHLLESVTDSSNQIQKYTVVYDDNTFARKASDGSQYLIKMHGDLSNYDSIVLKESDYLDYSNTHILISNFIRSLLATHIFLFVGYSLDDNNLKLIQNWINFMRNQLIQNRSVSSIPTNVLLYSPNSNNKYSNEDETIYFKSRNVDLIDLNKLPSNISEYGNKSKLKSAIGKQIYAFLEAINQREAYRDNISFLSRYMKNQAYIPFKDMVNILTVNEYLNYGAGKAVVSEKLFNKLSKNDDLTLNFLQRTQIHELILPKKGNALVLRVPLKTLKDTILLCVVTNRYTDLLKYMDSSNLEGIDKAFIHYVFHQADTLTILRTTPVLQRNNYSEFLIKQFNKSLIDGTDMKFLFQNQNKIQSLASGTIREIYNRNVLELRVNNDTIAKHLALHKGLYSGTASSFVMNDVSKYGKMDGIQYYAYDFYKYIRINRIFLDESWSMLFEPYIRAILITYIKENEKSIIPDNFNRRYPINDFDIDIMTKFFKYEELVKLFNEYHIQNLTFLSKARLIKNFHNLCRSITQYTKSKYLTMEAANTRDSLVRCLNNYVLILSYVKLSSSELQELCIMTFKIAKLAPIFAQEGLQAFLYRQFIIFSHDDSSTVRFITRILSNSEYEYLLSSMNNLVLNTFRKSMYRLYGEQGINDPRILKLIKQDNGVSNIYYFLFSDIFNERISDSLIKKYVMRLAKINAWLLTCIFDEPSFSDYQSIAFNALIANLNADKESIGRVYPDYELDRANVITYLVANGYKYKRKSLSIVTGIYPIFDFLFNPQKFDYSKIDLTDSTWQTFILNNLSKNDRRFKHQFAIHRDEILKNNSQIISDRIDTDSLVAQVVATLRMLK